MSFRKTLTEYRKHKNQFIDIGSSISLSLLNKKTINGISSSILDEKSCFDCYPNLLAKKHLKELKESFILFLKKQGIHGLSPNNIVIFRGSYDSYHTLSNLINPEQIILPRNISVSIRSAFERQNTEINEYQNNFAMPFSKPKGKLTGNSLLYFNNMFGQEITPKILKNIKRASQKTKLLIMDIDTGFIKNQNNEPPLLHKAIHYLKDVNAVCVYTMSKEFGLPGLRIAFGISNKEIVQEIEKFQEKTLTIISDINLILAKKAIEVVNFSNNIKELQSRNRIINNILPKNRQVLFGVNAFLKVPSNFTEGDKTTGEAYAEFLLKNHRIAVRPGVSYGKDLRNYVRIVSCIPKKELTKTIQKLKKINSKLENEQRINPAIKYSKFLDIDTRNHIDSGLKSTPLVNSPELAKWIGVKNIYIKNETTNPTGTVKDRFAEITFSYFKQKGINEYSHSSAGNTATALARMTKFIKKFSLTLYIPEAQHKYYNFTKNGKIRTFLLEKSNYDEASSYSKTVGGQNTLGLNSDFRKKINKLPYLEAYEQCYQHGYELDLVCQAISSGTGLIGANLAAQDALTQGWVENIPGFCAFQSEKVNPIVACYKAGKEVYDQKFTIKRTNGGVAFAIRRGDASSCYQAISELVRKSGGFMEDATEKEIRKAKEKLFEYTGINGGYTSCVAIAGLRKYAMKNNISSKSALIMLTGKDRSIKVKTKIDKIIPKKIWKIALNP